MAYVYKSEAGAYRSPYRSPLAKADFGRQRDCFKLAQRGVGDCVRLWNDFSSEAPELARLVVADVESEREDRAEVVKGLDKRLAKAERSAGKPGKPGKRPKWARMDVESIADRMAGAGVPRAEAMPYARKIAEGVAASAADRDTLLAASEVLRRAEAESCDPWTRETMRRMAARG